MKKLLVLAAFAALVIPSCNQTPIDLGGDAPKVQIQKAKNADVAKKVVIKEGPAKEAGYKSIDLADSGIYCIDLGTAVKADDDVQIITGTYTTEDGVTYILSGFGKVIFDANGNITIIKEEEGGETVELTATVENVEKLPENDFTRDIAHSWRIDKVDISVSADGKNIGFTKDGCNLYAIAKEIKAQAEKFGAKIEGFDIEKLNGYNVTRLTVTSSRTFIIEFDGAPTFKAEIPADKVVGYTFEYKLETGSDNDLLNASASCSFTPQTETTAWLRVQVKSESITGYVIFIMSQADAQ